MNAPVAEVRSALLRWFHAGHRPMPWRESRDPYRIWVSEIMLQQTRVDTVIPYFERWVARFPDVYALASADLQDVLQLWQGLGYYSRARNLHAAAQKIVADFGGEFPHDVASLLTLPGVGRYTAGAIASIAWDEPVPLLDGNVMRVLARLYDLPDDTTTPRVQKQLWEWAGQLALGPDAGALNQSLMELGATHCCPRQAACGKCPVQNACVAFARGTVDERPVRKAATPPRDESWRALIVTRSDGARLLVQRPSVGLWAGLWEYPLVAPEWWDGALSTWPTAAARPTAHPALVHILSHIRLQIQPVQVEWSPALHAWFGAGGDAEPVRWPEPYVAAKWCLTGASDRPPVSRLVQRIDESLVQPSLL